MAQQHTFQAPTGTRDFYPQEMLRRRYIEKAWRDASIRHGFEEIDGPTFEHLDLYTVKSGEGIVSELFSFERFGGEKTYALRPEFTPTLARMYASKANSLAKPTKWFTSGPFFRAERPQRGRLREFLQWNVDLMGSEIEGWADAEVLACLISALEDLGFRPADITVKIGDRPVVAQTLLAEGLPERYLGEALRLLDRKDRLSDEEFQKECRAIQLEYSRYESGLSILQAVAYENLSSSDSTTSIVYQDSKKEVSIPTQRLQTLYKQIREFSLEQWCRFDFSIVRGLAYYTGMVFEVHEAGGKERAIAGGGRYDNLIELFGGPPTPAVGFGMGDVVLSLVLQDRGLMPEGKALLEALSRPSPSLRPDAFVMATEAEGADAALAPTLAALRRQNLHARRSYKASRNPGKLIKDAAACHARFYVVVDSAETCTLKNLDTGEQHPTPVPLGDLPAAISNKQ
ncbi:MAG: ATP phosphoribosyltransferase regulatory subunit [Phycisphaerales bacterium]|nr:ATP phosphoribosyltransferase regulatory subunit [Phycisphaerales bacterium]